MLVVNDEGLRALDIYPYETKKMKKSAFSFGIVPAPVVVDFWRMLSRLSPQRDAGAEAPPRPQPPGRPRVAALATRIACMSGWSRVWGR